MVTTEGYASGTNRYSEDGADETLVVTTYKFVNRQLVTTESAYSTDFPVSITYATENIGTGAVSYVLSSENVTRDSVTGIL